MLKLPSKFSYLPPHVRKEQHPTLRRKVFCSRTPRQSRCPVYHHAMMRNPRHEFLERVDRTTKRGIQPLFLIIRILFCLPLILVFSFGVMAHILSGSAAEHAERQYDIPLPTIILHVRCVRLFLVLDTSLSALQS